MNGNPIADFPAGIVSSMNTFVPVLQRANFESKRNRTRGASRRQSEHGGTQSSTPRRARPMSTGAPRTSSLEERSKTIVRSGRNAYKSATSQVTRTTVAVEDQSYISG